MVRQTLFRVHYEHPIDREPRVAAVMAGTPAAAGSAVQQQVRDETGLHPRIMKIKVSREK